MHAFLTRDGTAPADLLALGREEVARYGVAHRNARATTASRSEGGLLVGLDDGRSVTARQLVVTTGLVDELPAVEGLAERWGRDVVHCPYCHGWEIRDRVIGVLATSPMALHQAGLFRQLSDHSSCCDTRWTSWTPTVLRRWRHAVSRWSTARWSGSMWTPTV
jgi:thioredoxin reductase